MSDRLVSIDRLIDDVARSMSAAESPALRARVVANLGRQRRGASVVLLPVAALAGAAAVAVALHWTPRAASPVRPAATVARAAAPAAPAPAVSSPPAASTHAATAEAAPAAEPDGPSIAALPGIEAMPVSDIQPKPLGVPQLNVEHVANVAPLSVAALDEIDRDR